METKKVFFETAFIIFMSVLLGFSTNLSLLKRYFKGEYQQSFRFSGEDAGVRFIGLGEAEDLFAKREALFIDSRSREIFRSGHVLGAMNIPLEENKNGLRIPLSASYHKTLVVYCEGGECEASVGLAKILHDNGFRDIRVFSGGWREWMNAGLPRAEGNDTQ